MSDRHTHDENEKSEARRKLEQARTESRERKAEHPEPDARDEVDLASSDSMDASDPPSFTPTKAGAPAKDTP